MVDPRRSVASLVLDHSECAAVFQRHHVDFCCHGEISVEAAARAKGIDPAALVEELGRAIAGRRTGGAPDPRELPTPRLVAHIVATHHEYLRRVLPFVRGLATKVSRVHGDRNAKLTELAATVEELAETLLPHLDAEESSLFPALTAGAVDGEAVRRELGSMMVDHLAVASLLDRVRAQCDEFTIPPWACGSYRTLFSELEQLEADVYTHVHLENHVLRPRFVPA